MPPRRTNVPLIRLNQNPNLSGIPQALEASQEQQLQQQQQLLHSSSPTTTSLLFSKIGNSTPSLFDSLPPSTTNEEHHVPVFDDDDDTSTDASSMFLEPEDAMSIALAEAETSMGERSAAHPSSSQVVSVIVSEVVASEKDDGPVNAIIVGGTPVPGMTRNLFYPSMMDFSFVGSQDALMSSSSSSSASSTSSSSSSTASSSRSKVPPIILTTPSSSSSASASGLGSSGLGSSSLPASDGMFFELARTSSSGATPILSTPAFHADIDGNVDSDVQDGTFMDQSFHSLSDMQQQQQQQHYAEQGEFVARYAVDLSNDEAQLIQMSAAAPAAVAVATSSSSTANSKSKKRGGVAPVKSSSPNKRAKSRKYDDEDDEDYVQSEDDDEEDSSYVQSDSEDDDEDADATFRPNTSSKSTKSKASIKTNNNKNKKATAKVTATPKSTLASSSSSSYSSSSSSIPKQFINTAAVSIPRSPHMTQEERYRRRRQVNNQSARNSRLKRKAREQDLREQVEQYRQDNDNLRASLNVMLEQIESLRQTLRENGVKF